MEEFVAKFTSRKWWAFVIAAVSAVAALMVGDLTVPDFVKAILVAAGTYQLAEGAVDAAARFGRQE